MMDQATELAFFGFESFEPNNPEAMANSSYLALLYRDVETVFQQPEFVPVWQQPTALKSITLLPSRAGLYRQEHMINLDARWVTGETRSLPIEQQKAIFVGTGIVVSKRLSDIGTLFHEICHEMYETIKPPPSIAEVEDSADRMISEGFATFMDIYFMDVLSQKPELLKLSHADQKALEEAKNKRIEMLGRNRNKNPHRTDGVLFIHNIFKHGKMSGGGNPIAGLQAVREFINGIDRKETLTTSRENYIMREIQELPKAA